MKIVGLFLQLMWVFLIVRGDDKDPHGPIREKCKKQFGLTTEELEAAISDPTDQGCYLLCFLKDLSIMDDNGEFYPDAAVNAIEEGARDQAKPVIFSCSDQEKMSTSKDACDRALEVVLCVKKEAPQLYENFGLFHPLGQ
uniref:Pbprp1_1 protein n=1 Tax=Fopius arisanus TaxID=64838 RepID=A0A0C9RWQ2_9HYME